jgi:protoheme IX farnesyltransferase
MPVLAGRAFGLGSIDWIGILLALGVLFWIPTHILTFSIRHQEDYQSAGVPIFPAVYGLKTTHTIISASSIMAALAMALVIIGLGSAWGTLRLLAVLSTGLFILAISSMLRPSERTNFGLFKYASVYMLSAMLLIVLETI